MASNLTHQPRSLRSLDGAKAPPVSSTLGTSNENCVLCIFLLAFTSACNADDWVCPDPKDEFCDSYHAEYIAEQADKRLNEVYRKLLSDYPEKGTKEEMEFTKIAQRAWLKYSEAHCAAILSKFGGATFTKAEMESTCRTEQINKRIKELESYCESCSDSLTRRSSGTPQKRGAP